MDKHGTSQSLRRSKHAIDFGSSIPGLFDGPAGRVARVSGLIVQLMHCPRKPSGASLANIAGWRHSSCPLPSGYSLLCINGPRWEPSDCWFRPSKKSPHVKVLMRSSIEAKEGEPSREEIFVIAYMMIHRLQSEGMDKHVIAPVMLLSIMAECHGRILIAYCDGGKLATQMSGLHCFYSRYQDSYTLMMRYLAAGDEGDTTTLLAKRGP
ncbi:hypothetical protein ATEIFO6365_0016007800 [Aspergillus terreus]|uniref:Uncharacterized protein n=1 Tax=Aspergillus terreus TaxID=33178 RepID=A0A5M3ZDS9_ASPTE|nr:hypothetical protein ATETN484_0017008300 [Aspergillus terreus]GFF21754.1 hypothetical protein ATEIFO6365_0016007800 [Aspergillus terreus]